MFLDQLLQRDTHLLFHNTRVVDMSTDTEDFGSSVTFSSESGKPTTSSTSDGRCNGDSLDVGDGGRTTEKSDVGGEGRLESGFALLALEGFCE